MKRLLGVVFLVALLYGMLLARNPAARSGDNLRDIANLHGFYGVLTLGVAVLIITGGIDLSIGSVVGLSAVCFIALMRDGVRPTVALGTVVVGGMVIGLLQSLPRADNAGEV